MISARCLLGAGLIVAATHAQAADWIADDITDILNKVRSIFTTVTGDVKEAASELVEQKKKRTQDLRDNVDDIFEFFQNRQTPLKDFVSGGQGRCGTGSPCATFRTDLRTFALQLAELRDRFPVLAQQGLGDTTFFAELVKILPPFVLFGLHEILERIPKWQDLPVDLADIFDEMGDPDAFSTAMEPSPLAAGVTGDMKTAMAASRAALPLNKPGTELEKFCNQGKEAGMDDLRFVRWKNRIYRWKNLFDSFSAWPKDDQDVTILGQSFPNVKYPTGPFLKTVSNALDSVHNMMETHREKLALCERIEADLAVCAPLAEYRTQAGSKKAYQVVAGIMTRPSLAALDKTSANLWFNRARLSHNAGKYKEAYGHLCTAYAAL